MKERIYINDIGAFLTCVSSEKRVYFFGAGGVGRATASFLKKYSPKAKVAGFLVSAARKHPASICNIPVYSIDEINDFQDVYVIVTTKCDLHEEIEKTLQKAECQGYAFFSDALCLQLLHELELDDLRSEARELKAAMLRLTPQPRLEYFVLNILDFCNLNCRGCDHFAPLAGRRYVPFETIASDLKRFSELMERNVMRIGVMGGEPLLHPQLSEVLKATRESFPDAKIQLDTNGILLLKQGDAFWENCRDCRVVIVNTKYPISLDHGEIERVCAEKGVDFEYYGDTGRTLKTSYKMVMNPSGLQDPRESFSGCFHANNCNTLIEGKLFPCTVAPNAHIFNEYFHEHLDICRDDYLDIYDPALTQKDVLAFLARPIPFCRYCDVKHRSYGHPWSTSKREKTEWTL